MSIHEEAKRLLKLFEFDEKRTNDMAARTLLSLLNLREGDTWDQATNNRIGVRGLMDWMRNNLDFPIAETPGRLYAERFFISLSRQLFANTMMMIRIARLIHQKMYIGLAPMR